MSKVCSCRGEKGTVCARERWSDQEDEDEPLLGRGDGKVKGQSPEDVRSKDNTLPGPNS